MTPAIPTQPRNTERCPQCGYSLQGHADSGQCPECGRTYDQSLVVIDGWLHGRGASGNVYASRRPTALLSVWAANAFSSFLLIGVLRSHMKWLGILPLVVPLLCYLLSREQDDTPSTQLILGPEGYMRRDHPASAMVTIHHLYAVGTFASLALLMAMGSPMVMLGYVCIYVAGFLIAAGFSYIRQRFRPAVHTEISGEQIVLTPWRASDEIIIDPLQPGTWRVTLGNKPQRRRSFRLTSSVENVFRFEADLSDERVEHLAAQMASWPIKLTVTRQTPRPRWWQRLIRRR